MQLFEDNIFYAQAGNKNTSMLSTDGKSTLVNVTLNHNLYFNKGSEDGSGLLKLLRLVRQKF